MSREEMRYDIPCISQAIYFPLHIDRVKRLYEYLRAPEIYLLLLRLPSFRGGSERALGASFFVIGRSDCEAPGVPILKIDHGSRAGSRNSIPAPASTTPPAGGRPSGCGIAVRPRRRPPSRSAPPPRIAP